MSVWIAPRVRKHISRHQGLRPDEEVVGIIAVKGLYRRESQCIYPLKNEDPEPDAFFQVDPLKQLATEQHIEALGGRVLGYYHTHPRTDPQPSTADRSSWVPGMVYVIYCPLDGGAFTVWKDGSQHE